MISGWIFQGEIELVHNKDAGINWYLPIAINNPL
jgi:hypothetical protein